MSNTKLYVGGLPFTTSEDELKELFSTHGNIESIRIITDRDTGRSRGFAFVEMGSQEESQAAMSALNGTTLGGRNLIVNEAKPKPEGGGGDRSFGRSNRW